MDLSSVETSPNGTSSESTDAKKLLRMAAESLAGPASEGPLRFSPESFNDSGTPQILYVGRGEEGGEVQWAIWTGRSQLKSHVKSGSGKLYKRLRRSLLAYEMGEEVPVFSQGRGGYVSHAIVTFDDPEIKPPN
jgi:hypothetical protein